MRLRFLALLSTAVVTNARVRGEGLWEKTLTRDRFGSRDEAAGYHLSPSILVHWLEVGNNDFTPRNPSGRTVAQNWQEATEAIADFAKGL